VSVHSLSIERDSKSDYQPILAGMVGNVMEWYDFTAYGYFASVIGRNFFPSASPLGSLIAAFGVFAAGFLMRPVGSLIFGHIGDKFDRNVALVISVVTMALPTFLIGLLPTYQQIGVAAPLLLTFLRLAQGLSVGGEYTTSFIYLVEHAPPKHRGLFGSLGPVGVAGGILLGSAIGAILTTWLDAQAIAAWGWRVPFILGIGVGLAGYYIRRQMPLGNAEPKSGQVIKFPVGEAFRTEWPSMLRIFAFLAFGGIGWYLCFVYVTTWLRQTEHIPASTAFDINVIAILLLMVLGPVFGGMSDRVGRKPIVIAAIVSSLLLVWPLFWLMHHPSPAMALLGQCGLAALIAAYIGPASAFMVEAFPTRVRCSALSFAYSASLSIFGGTAPMVAVFTIQHTQDDLSPAFYMIGAAVISLLATISFRETSRAVLP
jgi:MFS transporter, MHS family, proline/betaine transporter